MGFIAWFAFALDLFDLSVRNIQNKQWKDLACVHVGHALALYQCIGVLWCYCVLPTPSFCGNIGCSGALHKLYLVVVNVSRLFPN
jgi:hypothetical protein